MEGGAGAVKAGSAGKAATKAAPASAAAAAVGDAAGVVPAARPASAKRACDNCYIHKRRCTGDGVLPCAACVQKGLDCSYSPRAVRTSRPRRRRTLDADADDEVALPPKRPSTGGSSSSRQNPPPRACAPLPPRAGGWDAAAWGGGGDQLAAPLTHMPRLSPSSATGLLGLREHHFLAAFVSAYAATLIQYEAEFQPAIVEIMRAAGGAGAGGGGSGRGDLPLADAAPPSAPQASLCSLWTAISFGAMVQGASVYAPEVRGYLRCAERAAHAAHQREGPTLTTLHAFMMLTNVYVMLEDFNKLGVYLETTTAIAKSIARAHARALARLHDRDELHATESVPPPLQENTWFLLEALRLAKLLVDMGVRMCAAELSKHQRGAVTGISAQQSASAPASSPPGGSAPRPPPNSKLGLVFASYAPVVEGLPSFDPKEVQEAIEEGGCIGAPQAAQLSRHNVVASALTELCKPSVAYADGLVSAACYGGKDLLLVVMGINQRLGQVMHMINSGGAAQPAVRVAGARLRVMVDRVVRALRGGLLRRAGFNQVKLVSDAAFLHLLDSDEEGCLQLLLELLRMCHAAPGLMRFIPWRHNYHWAAALLLSAGLCERYIEFARLYNALCMGGGLDQLPLDEAGKAALCRCKNDRCAAAHRVVAERAASGAAHIFLNYTLLSNATAAVMPAAAHAPISVVSCPMGVRAPPAAVMDEYTVEAVAAAAPGLAAAAAAPPIVPQLPRQTQAQERHAAFAAAGPASGAVAPMAQSAANVVHRSPPSGLTHFGGSASSLCSQGSGYSSGGSGGGGAAIPVTWNTNLSAQAALGRSAAAAAAAAAAGADFVSADSDYAAAHNVWSAASLPHSSMPGLRGQNAFGGGGGGTAAGGAPVGSGTVGDAAAARIHADWSASVMHLPHSAPAPYVFSGGSAGSGASAWSDEEELMAALAAELEADELNDLLQLSGGVAAPLPPELQWQQAWQQQQQQQRVPEEPLHYEQQLLGASSFASAQAAPFHQQPQPQHNAALAALAAASPALSDMDLATVLLSDDWLADECL